MRTPFQQTVAEFIEELPHYVNYLATHFEVSPSTVVRWTDVAVPHERMQVLILAQIEEIRKTVI